MNVTDEIKSRLDIVDVIGNYVPLKKSGRNYKALCPFHTEKTPSFVVFPESQQWRCFGACAEGGDIFNFIMKHEGWDFPEALRFLADMAGVELKPPTPQQAERREQTERLHALIADAAGFFHRQLLQAPNAEHARAYATQRGLTDETLESFLVGYAPDGWETTLNWLMHQGWERQDIIDAGLLVVRDDQRIYDRFRDRLMIPIRDIRGNVVGFGARALAKDAVPKYLNSPQSPIFDKSELLYGMSHARRSIRESETAVIVEGYMDVMQAHQGGFTHVVAEMGTALTEPQLRRLARYASRLILALDPDAAGQMATQRGREVIERVSRAAAEQVGEDGVWDFDSAEREYRARVTTEFDARGMLRYESRMGFDIRVAVLPEGMDPDDLIREQPGAWAALLDDSLPIVEYAIQQAVEGKNLDDAKIKAQVAAEVVPLIEDVADAVERSHYRQRLTRLLRVPESSLFPERPAPAARRSSRRRQPIDRAGGRPDGEPWREAPPTRSREAFCLAALLQYPRLIYRVNRVMAEFLAPENGIGPLEDETPAGERLDMLAWRITPGDFALPEHREIYACWQQALDQDAIEPTACLREALDASNRQLVDRWLEIPLYALLREVAPPPVELSDERVFDEVIHALLTLREHRLNDTFQEIAFLLQDEAGGGDSLTVQQYQSILKDLFTTRDRVTRALKQYGPLGKSV